MSRDEIKKIIDDFLLLVEKGCGSVEENEKQLKLLLDKLAFAQHFASYEFDEKDYEDLPEQNYKPLRDLVKSRFPDFGNYNLAKDVSNNLAETEVMVGDAIDDIADIAGDLYDISWCWNQNSAEDGLWHFKNGFSSHWGRHLRELQLYLFNLEQGT
jgi:hypothetical protein